MLMVRGTAAADRSIHEIQITASRYAFDPVASQVSAGEPVRIVIRTKDGVHGFSIPRLKMAKVGAILIGGAAEPQCAVR